MGIINENILTATGGITIDEIRQVLRATSYDLKTLCLASYINAKSRRKPNGCTTPFLSGSDSDSERFSRLDNYGYDVRYFQSVYDCLEYAFNHKSTMTIFNNSFYERKHTPSVFRMIDFVGYCHSAATNRWAYYFDENGHKKSFEITKDPNDNIDMDVSNVSPIIANPLKEYILPCSTMRYNNYPYDSDNPDAYTIGSCKIFVMGCNTLDSSTSVIHNYFVKNLKATIDGVTKNLTFDELAEIPNAWYTNLANSNVIDSEYNVCFLALSPNDELDVSGQDLSSTHPINQTFIVLPDTLFSLTVSHYTASQALGHISMSLNCYVADNRFYAIATLSSSSNYSITSDKYISMVLRLYYYGSNDTLDHQSTYSNISVGKNQSTTKKDNVATQDIGYNVSNIKKVVMEYSITPQDGNASSISIIVERPSGGWPTTPPQG